VSAAPITIGVVEDDAGFRESLRALIGARSDLALVGAFGSAEEAVERLVKPGPAVLLLDVRLPGEPGSRAVRRLIERFPATVVVMLTLYADDEHVFEALCNGASGYLLKRTPATRLLESIREANEGGSPMSPAIARKVVDVFRRFPNPAAKPGAGLTTQEVRFLSLLARGHSYQSAADELEVSVNTVRKYVRAVYEKLHVHSRSEAVGKALRAGLI
jgi:DNA-binding NarL/FixJ family response regulator